MPRSISGSYPRSSALTMRMRTGASAAVLDLRRRAGRERHRVGGGEVVDRLQPHVAVALELEGHPRKQGEERRDVRAPGATGRLPKALHLGEDPLSDLGRVVDVRPGE